MKQVMKSATSLDSLAGERVKELREGMGLTQVELGERVASVVGGGWSRQVVWQVEQGKRSLTAADLLALAKVCSVPPSDIVGSHEPVSLGGDEAVVTASLMGTPSGVATVDGWARFEAAGAALAEVRSAWARYVYEIDVVRQRIAGSSELRERVEAFKGDAIDIARAELAALDADDAEHARILGLPTPSPSTGDDVARNATPAMYAARDALAHEELPARIWTIRPRPKEKRND